MKVVFHADHARLKTGRLKWSLLSVWRVLGMAQLAWSLAAATAQSFPPPPPPVSVIRLLALYTPQACDGAGGAAAMARQINTAVFEANAVFQNSQVNARIQLALAARITYTESGTVSNDLARLRNPRDPAFALARQLRDQCEADLVCLITETGDDWSFYGLQGPSADNAYSVLRRPFLTGQNYLPVTLSFNFGCQLERANADSQAAFSYAYGHTFQVGWATFSSVEGFEGERLPFFSNPNLQIQGVPAGIPAGQRGAADNVRALNQTAPAVASFRGATLQTTPPQAALIEPKPGARFRAGTSIRLSSAASDSDGRVRRVDYYADTNWLGSAASPPFIAFWRQARIGEYSVVAVATDSAGAVTVSDPVPFTVGPSNDNFAQSAFLTGRDIRVRATNTLASLEAGEPEHAGVPAEHSLWWTWTAPADGALRLETRDTVFRHLLAAYTGSVLNALSPVASGIGWDSVALRFPVSAGCSYSFAVGGQGSEHGALTLRLLFSPTPTNDAFAQRARLQGSHLVVRADNSGASRQAGEPEHDKTPGCASLWYSWTAPESGTLALNVPEAEFPAWLLALYTGNSLADLVEIPSWDGPGSLRVRRGQTCQLAIDIREGYTAHLGPFTLRLDFDPAPRNDDFLNRIAVAGTRATLIGSTAQASLEPGDPCSDPSIWWSWTAPISGLLTLTSDNPDSPHLALYQGEALDTLKWLKGSWPVLNCEVEAGTTYAIALTQAERAKVTLDFSSVRLVNPAPNASYTVGTDISLNALTTTRDGVIERLEFRANVRFVGAVTHAPYSLVWRQPPQGDYELTALATDRQGHTHSSPSIPIRVGPANATFAGSLALAGSELRLTNNAAGAFGQMGAPGFPAGIWWTWTAPASGLATITLDADGGFWGGYLVFAGDPWSQGTRITNGVNSGSFPVVRDTTYHLCAYGQYGEIRLHLWLSTLQISHPVNGLRWMEGATLPIEVSSTSMEGRVQQVEFFANGVSLGLTTAPPFCFVWSNVPPGDFILTAISSGEQGTPHASPPVSISVSPANDSFAQRQGLAGTPLAVIGSLASASLESGEPAFDDGYSHGSVWYSWTASEDGPFLLSVSSGYYSLGLSVYTGSNLTELLPVTNAWYRLAFTARAGVTYQIRVHAVRFAYQPGGAFILRLDPSPPNDDFDRRSPIVNLDAAIQGNNFAATAEADEPAPTYFAERSLWWSWVAPRSGRLVVHSSASNAMPLLNLFTGRSLSELSQVPRLNGGAYSGVEESAFAVEAGTEYQLDADQLWNPDGSVAFTLSFLPYAANDDFSHRQVLAGSQLSVEGDNSYASEEPGQPSLSGAQTGRSVWYAWTAPAGGLLSLSLSSLGDAPTLGLFQGTQLDALMPVPNTSSAPLNWVSRVRAGQTYAIEIDGGSGPFTLGLTFLPGPEHGLFAERIPLAGLRTSTSGTTFRASLEPGEPSPGWGALGSVWYSWTAPATGHVRVRCPDRMLYVYAGPYLEGRHWAVTNVDALNWVATAVDGLAEFDALADNEYCFQVSSRSNSLASDSFTLSLELSKVLLTAPEPGTVFPSPTNLTLAAATIDLEERVETVEFFAGTQSLGLVTHRPFELTWTNVPEGSHWLWALGSEASGLANVSAPVELRVAPANDSFTHRIQLEGTRIRFTGDNRAASSEPGEPGSPAARTLWWSWIAPAEGRVTITNGPLDSTASGPGRLLRRPALSSVSSTVIDTVPLFPAATNDLPWIEVFSGQALDQLTWCTNNLARFWYFGDLRLPEFNFTVRQGVAYQIRLGGERAYGAAEMNLSFVPTPIPTNDVFARRAPLSGASVPFSGTTLGAAREWGEPVPYNDLGARTVWYSWTAPASGTVLLQPQSQFYPIPELRVFAGSALLSLIAVDLSVWPIRFFRPRGHDLFDSGCGNAGMGREFRIYPHRSASAPGPRLGLLRSPPQPHLSPPCDRPPGPELCRSILHQSAGLAFPSHRHPSRELLGLYRFGRRTVAPMLLSSVALESALNSSPTFTLVATHFEPGTGCVLRLMGEPGQPYRLMSSTNLLDWSELTRGILTTNSFEFTDPFTSHQRFYRAERE